jgi:hypothetical protein
LYWCRESSTDDIRRGPQPSAICIKKNSPWEFVVFETAALCAKDFDAD